LNNNISLIIEDRYRDIYKIITIDKKNFVKNAVINKNHLWIFQR